MEHENLQKIMADRAKTTPDIEADAPEQAQPFDLRTAGPLDLQRMIGNKATTALLKSGSSVIQTKMTVTAANDAHEQEADKVAEQVVSRGLQAKNLQRDGDDVALQRIQREGEEEEDPEAVAMKRLQRDTAPEEEVMEQRLQRDTAPEEEVMEQRVQRKDDVDMMGAFDVGGGVEEQISAASGGQKMDDGVRGQMESGIGADFSNVNVHTDANSDALNRSLQARAFTHGNDVFFRSGEYNPGTSDGQKLIAHELTHVVQQGGAQAKREDAE